MYSKSEDSYFGSQMKEKQGRRENSGSMYEGNIYQRLESIGNQVDSINTYIYGLAETQNKVNETLAADNRETRMMLDENTKSVMDLTKLHNHTTEEHDKKAKQIEYKNCERFERLKEECRELSKELRYHRRMLRVYKIVAVASAVVSVSALLVSIIF